MSIENVYVYAFADILMALQVVQDDDTLNLNIKNDITFGTAAMMGRRVTVNLINDSGSESVVLAIAYEGSYRHFMTGTTGIDGISMTVGRGIILNGGGTGGGIQMFGSGSSLTLDGCMIFNCRNSGNGGGILLQGNVSRSRLSMNDARIEGCQAGAGGGVFASACDVQMNGGQITGNRANNTGGGMITIAGSNGLGSTLTMRGGNVNQNTVGSFGDGGGISAFDTVVMIDGSVINYNVADNYGGGIYSFNQSGDVNLNALIIKDSTVAGNTTRNTGGGIGVQNALSEFTITGCIIMNNQADSAESGTKQGGGIYLAGGSLTVIDSKVTANTAGSSGGGIFAVVASLTVKGTAEISENEAVLTAGGIYGFQGATIAIEENAAIINNRAYCGNDAENASRGGGGIALLSYGMVSTLVVTGNARISGNMSVSYGGGIWTYPTFGPETVVRIEGGAIEGNTANYGGGISMGEIPGYTPTLTITGGVITNNFAFSDGGGIITMGSIVAASYCEIAENIAGRDGGGIFTDQLSNVTLYDSVIFSGNIASSYVYWLTTSGGDSGIYLLNIFTEHFSTFIPVQTLPAVPWAFLNAYNNYDINYVRPDKSITVRFSYVSELAVAVHETVIDSFLGATVLIPPRDTITDIDGTVWTLEPPGQPPQVFRLTDPEADYTVTFSFEPALSMIVVIENYLDEYGNKIMDSTYTNVEVGGNYSKEAPDIENYAFLGYRIDQGPLMTGSVNIIGIEADAEITFVYRRECKNPCTCSCCCYCLCRT